MATVNEAYEVLSKPGAYPPSILFTLFSDTNFSSCYRTESSLRRWRGPERPHGWPGRRRRVPRRPPLCELLPAGLGRRRVPVQPRAWAIDFMHGVSGPTLSEDTDRRGRECKLTLDLLLSLGNKFVNHMRVNELDHGAGFHSKLSTRPSWMTSSLSLEARHV